MENFNEDYEKSLFQLFIILFQFELKTLYI